jgi:hypothetical protein
MPTRCWTLPLAARTRCSSILEPDQLGMQAFACITFVPLARSKELPRLLGRLCFYAPFLGPGHLHGCVEQLELALCACWRHESSFRESVVPAA